MAKTKTLEEEKAFIIDLAIKSFNRQFNQKLKQNDVEIESIEANYNSDLGYHIWTKRDDDYVDLHLYLKFDILTDIVPWRIEVNSDVIENALGDEVYVSASRLNKTYRDTREYLFRWLGDKEPPPGYGASFVDGDPMEFVDGSPFEFLNE
jgi:hypothetical protein